MVLVGGEGYQCHSIIVWLVHVAACRTWQPVQQLLVWRTGCVSG